MVRHAYGNEKASIMISTAYRASAVCLRRLAERAADGGGVSLSPYNVRFLHCTRIIARRYRAQLNYRALKHMPKRRPAQRLQITSAYGGIFFLYDGRRGDQAPSAFSSRWRNSLSMEGRNSGGVAIDASGTSELGEQRREKGVEGAACSPVSCDRSRRRREGYV